MIQIVESTEIPSLARCKKDGTILIRPDVSPEEFFAYFQGEKGKISEHKKEVLDSLDHHGWPLKKIRQLITTAQKVRRFLLLHEASHIRHRDCEVVKEISREARTAIETRACLEALIQMAFEAAVCRPIQPQTTPCKQPTPPNRNAALPCC